MTASGESGDRDDELLALLEPIVGRVIAARVTNRDLADDLVQETLSRVFAARPKLEDQALIGYTIVSARRVVADHFRQERRRRRLEPRLADLRAAELPEAAALAEEERRAMQTALAQLSEQERASLLAHGVAGVDRRTLAETAGSSPGTIGVRLTRARAKLRVEYLLALRRIHLPTPRCRPILLAISAGDRARQRELRIADHLIACTTCSALTPDLLQRRRPLFGLWPIALLAASFRWLRRLVRGHPAPAAVVGVSAVLAAAVIWWPQSPPPPPPSQPLAAPPSPPDVACGGTLTVAGRPLALGDETVLRQLTGQAVEGSHLPVESVPANEGAWIGCDQGRLWLQLVGKGESAFTIKAGQRLDFSGRFVSNAPGFGAGIGLTSGEGADDLSRQGYHIEVPYAKVRLRP